MGKWRSQISTTRKTEEKKQNKVPKKQRERNNGIEQKYANGIEQKYGEPYNKKGKEAPVSSRRWTNTIHILF